MTSHPTCERFAHDDAAYALGALDPDEARDYEQHLNDCPPCALEAARARADVALLRGLPAVAFRPDPASLAVPDTLLPSLAKQAARETRRRRWTTAGLALAAAACLVALLVSVWPSSSTSPPPSVPLAARVQTNLQASARLESVTHGTRIDLRCEYRSVGPETGTLPYALVVVDRRMRAHTLYTWDATPNVAATYDAVTTVPLDQITRVQVTTTSGLVILELTR